ncbi:conserved hypothetical protein, partial [delta proteobacterium NaphS2]
DDQEESIGDLWLGIDEDKDANDKGNENKADPGKKDEPLKVELALEIDENNLIEVTASMKELPHIRLAKTLSRGSADEKLLLSLEKVIQEANEKKYGYYIMMDLLERSLSAVRDINRVVSSDTGSVDEKRYKRANLKIQKARRMAAEGRDSKPMIYYAEDSLNNFGPAIPSATQKSIRKKIAHLEKMDEEGTYEENIKAIDDLDAELDKMGIVNNLMNLQKAGEFCEETDPSKAAEFFRAIDGMLMAFSDNNVEKAFELMEDIYPKAIDVIHVHEAKTDIIYKDITR